VQRQIRCLHTPIQANVRDERIQLDGRAILEECLCRGVEVHPITDAGVRVYEVNAPPFSEGCGEGGGLLLVHSHVCFGEEGLGAEALSDFGAGFLVEIHD
jgi:hypothetical protein